MTVLDEPTKNLIALADEPTLQRIQERVLWLACSMVHHANKVRATTSGVKVGGHQASSASMTSIMTALYFDSLRSGDRVSVKPHAGPVLHAINYLLDRLDVGYLTKLRAFGGLQSYPSRTKDPDPVDFSTGSVGIGATATIWNALSHRYLTDHFDVQQAGRSIAILGDAEMDEGAVWEALTDPMVPQLGELMWVVDLNRQSLDRVVPDMAIARIRRMFEAAGWQTISVKWGRQLRGLFERTGGDALCDRLDRMSNEEYQRLLRSPASDLRLRVAQDHPGAADIKRLLSDLDDHQIRAALRDLGGHDLADLTDAFGQASAQTGTPTVVFAYTIKAWNLPTEGHPANHSALLTNEQWHRLALDLGADSEDPWAAFDPTSPEARWCRATARRLQTVAPAASPRPAIPSEIGRPHAPLGSTQQALGRFLVDLAATNPAVAERVVTVSPDVASSTNLGGWINKVGVWNPQRRTNWFSDDPETVMHWTESQAGQHIELGIAEGNLVGLLGELGATWSRDGHALFPIGTIYDPFVTRALEQWSFGIYAGGQSILVGTPSGITLAGEGGAHQSIITPSIGLEQPQCTAWEPCFAQDLEWTMLDALRNLAKPGGSSAYFRLSTRPIDQSLATLPDDAASREQRRRSVVAGGYALRRSSAAPAITLVGMGVVMPELVGAADQLSSHGVACDVICITSADLLFRSMQARQGLGSGDAATVGALFPAGRAAPIVTALDGHPHTLSFLAAINGSRQANLGVNDFGQAGDVDDLYRHHGIDAATIVGAAWDLIDGPLSI